MNVLSVLILHRDMLIGHALRALLSQVADVNVVGVVHSFSDALELDNDARIVLVDLHLLDASAGVMVENVEAVHPDVSFIALVPRVAVLSTSISAVLRTRISGFLAIDVDPEALVEGIRAVDRGEFVVSPSLSVEFAQSLRSAADRIDKLLLYFSNESRVLTPREYSVVRLLSDGMTNSEIAAELFLSEATIKANLRRIMRKWDVRDRVQVLIRAVQEGVVQL